jgi:hypothetical protein
MTGGDGLSTTPPHHPHDAPKGGGWRGTFGGGQQSAGDRRRVSSGDPPRDDRVPRERTHLRSRPNLAVGRARFFGTPDLFGASSTDRVREDVVRVRFTDRHQRLRAAPTAKKHEGALGGHSL